MIPNVTTGKIQETSTIYEDMVTCSSIGLRKIFKWATGAVLTHEAKDDYNLVQTSTAIINNP